jgi:predicted TPR repeat methyltransferase
MTWKAGGVTGEDSSDDWLLQGTTDAGEVAGRYNQWAATYDHDLAAWSYRAPELVAGRIVDRLPDARSVLDAGCGTGLVGRALRAAGFAGEIHGTDVSKASLDVAEMTNAYTTLAVADLQRPMDNADDSFDALACVGVMTYVPGVETAWREFARVVGSGGLIVVTQREDLWDSRGCQGVIDALAEASVWAPLEVTGPEPYLPGNPDGMAPVGVYYVTARVR